MRPRRVLIITPGFGGKDGIAAVARQFAAALPPISHTRTLEVWSLGDAERPSGLDAAVAFRGAAGRRLSFASYALRQAGSLRDTLVIVTHVHLLPVVLPLLIAGARVVPVLMGIEAWKPLRPLELRALRRAWRVLAISQHTIDRFIHANPALAGLPVQVCNPSVPEGAPPHPAAIVGRYALIVGRMASEERYKGHDLLIDVWPAVREAVPDAQLVMVGDGDDRERLQNRAVTLGLDHAVRFTGRIDDATLGAYYRDAVLFVMPSRDEGFGLVFLEAMREGTPCIAASGAAEEIVRDGVDGFVVGPDDREALTTALVRLFSDESLRHRMGMDGQARVSSRFTPDHFAQRVHQLLALDEVTAAC